MGLIRKVGNRWSCRKHTNHAPARVGEEGGYGADKEGGEGIAGAAGSMQTMHLLG